MGDPLRSPDDCRDGGRSESSPLSGNSPGCALVEGKGCNVAPRMNGDTRWRCVGSFHGSSIETDVVGQALLAWEEP